MARLLDRIDSPLDLKRLKPEDLPRLCQEIRDEIVGTCALNGGHLGSSLSAVELIVALHYVYNSPLDKLVFDVGHQAYAHKLLTGRRDQFHTIRTEGGLAGFPERAESAHDAFGVGHASTAEGHPPRPHPQRLLRHRLPCHTRHPGAPLVPHHRRPGGGGRGGDHQRQLTTQFIHQFSVVHPNIVY